MLSPYECSGEHVTGASLDVHWNHPSSVSMRWLFPLMRHTGVGLRELPLVVRDGVGLETLSLFQTRIAHPVLTESLASLVARADDATLGISAAERLAHGDFDVVEFAARTAPSLGAALLSIGCFLPLLHGGLRAELTESRLRAIWTLTSRDDVKPLPVASEYALALMAVYIRRYFADDFPLREVRFTHARPADTAEYRRVFATQRLSFGARHNAMVFDAALLDRPMKLSHRGLHEVYQAQARAQTDAFAFDHTLKGRVRRMLVEQLSRGEVSRAHVASRLAKTESSLRRGLAEEGTSYREELEHLRRELAEHYLADDSLAIGEVRYKLGFRETGSFYKAFRRWFGHATPAATRKRRDPPS
jgi:AraC-like DNA-binding protein